MKRRTWGVALALAALLAPQLAWAEGLATNGPAATEAIRIADVTLHEGGRLQGQVVDANGIIQHNTLVYVRQNEKIFATTTTNNRGEFSIAGLRGGVYQVVTASGGGVFRLWAPGTAPPAAQASALVVEANPVVRGGLEPGPLRRTLVVGGIAAAAGVAGGAIGYAIRDNKGGS